MTTKQSRIELRVTPAEKARLERLAAKCDQSVSDYIRDSLDIGEPVKAPAYTEPPGYEGVIREGTETDPLDPEDVATRRAVLIAQGMPKPTAHREARLELLREGGYLDEPGPQSDGTVKRAIDAVEADPNRTKQRAGIAQRNG